MSTIPPVLKPNDPKALSPLKIIAASRPAVLAILFCVTAALGLPLLWKSPAFSKEEKMFWSIVISIYTLVLLCGTGMIVWWAYQSIRSVAF